MRVLFSYTYYTSNVASGRGKDDWSSTHRALVYGTGLIASARMLQRHFPSARMIVHVPQAEIDAKETRLKDRRHTYLKALMRMPNVDICVFTPEHIGRTHMSRGQMLRMSRYLPFLKLAPGRAVVVRDADSILSVRDIQHIKAWLKDETRNYLVYRELEMGTDMPMGGGLAIKNEPVNRDDWENAVALEEMDEHALTRMLPNAVVEQMRELAEKKDPRSAARSMLKASRLRLLRTRMKCNGDWYEYDSKSAKMLWRDSEEEWWCGKQSSTVSDTDLDWVR